MVVNSVVKKLFDTKPQSMTTIVCTIYLVIKETYKFSSILVTKVVITITFTMVVKQKYTYTTLMLGSL
jgi:hypothetical protein